MNKLIICIFLVISVVGCAVQKEWVASGGSRADGVIQLSYDFGQFEIPQVNEEQAMKLAEKRCQTWGYYGAEAFSGTKSRCTRTGGLGDCVKTTVTKKYQCLTK